MLERHYLTSLFEPKTVAVIGASERENSVGSVIFRNILDSGYKGRLYPINPKHESIHGIAAYKSIEDIGARVELAVIATKPKTVPEIVEQCGRSGIKNIIIISAGFSESGHAGAALERKTLEIARSYGVRVLGPNCLGIIRPRSASMPPSPASPPASATWRWFAIRRHLLGRARLGSEQQGRLLQSVISLGSTADVDFGEILDYLVYDNRTHYILLYIEGIRNSRRFMSALRSAARIKPIILLKAGRHAGGSAAVQVHSGMLAGSDIVFDAAIRRRRRARQDHRAVVLRLQGAGLEVQAAGQAAGDHHQRRRTGRHGGRSRRRHGHPARRAVGRHHEGAEQPACRPTGRAATRSTSSATPRPRTIAMPSWPSRRMRASTASSSCSRRRR
jgi:acetyltransferase